MVGFNWLLSLCEKFLPRERVSCRLSEILSDFWEFLLISTNKTLVKNIPSAENWSQRSWRIYFLIQQGRYVTFNQLRVIWTLAKNFLRSFNKPLPAFPPPVRFLPPAKVLYRAPCRIKNTKLSSWMQWKLEVKTLMLQYLYAMQKRSWS